MIKEGRARCLSDEAFEMYVGDLLCLLRSPILARLRREYCPLA
jgi:hypothetical protein